MNTYLSIGLAVVAVLVIVPFLLPASQTVERSAVVAAPADKLYALIASNEGFQTFNPYKLQDANLKVELYGPQSGVGSGFAFESKDGKGTSTIVAVEENKRVQMALDLGPMGKPITTFTLTPSDAQTRVTWSTTSHFGNNPIGRVVGLFLDKILGGTYEMGLQQLAKVSTAR